MAEHDRSDGDGAPPAPPESDLLLGHLRSIVLEPYTARLEAYEREIEGLRADVEALRQPAEPMSAADVGALLPAAIRARGEHDTKLAGAMRPLVETGLNQSVAENPQPLIDVIFPIIGPAIRKAVATAMRGLVASVNRTVESTFTPRGIRWRLESWRTGTSYAEIVLKHTLLYRVEGAYLIHRSSGLLLQHAVAPEVEIQDPALVSSMLTAIEDFARDSFSTDGEAGLEQIRVGDLTVLVESGPQAAIALAVRGVAVPALRTLAQEALESVHADYASELKAFRGQSAPFEPTHATLQSCLRDEERTSKKFPVAALVTGLLLATIGTLVLLNWVSERVERKQWTAYVERLREQPGLMVVHTEERDGRYHVVGLRDPLAPDPWGFLEDHNVARGRVDARWEYYRAQHPDFVLTRARHALRPPASVRLDLVDRILRPEGTASAAWIEDAERLTSLIPGVTQWDGRALRDERLVAFDAPIAAVEEIHVALGSEDRGEGLTASHDLQRRLAALDVKAAGVGARVVVQLVVFVAEGPAGDDDWLRATLVRDELMERSWQATQIKLVRTSPSQRDPTKPVFERTVAVQARVRFASLTPPPSR